MPLMPQESPIHKYFRESVEELRRVTGIERWRAPFCEKYFLILGPEYQFRVSYEWEKGYWHNSRDWEVGNYFETEDEALAKAEAIKRELLARACRPLAAD